MPERASYEEAAALIPKYLRPGLMTNLADPAGLRRDELRILKLENGLFILRRRESWEALSFLMTSGPVPELPGMVVTEIPNSQRVTGAAEIFKDAGYRVILERVRLARRARGAEESGSPDAAGSAGGFAGTEISPALPGEAEAVAELLRGSFDALTGCLPGEAQLREDIDRGLVLAARSGSVIAGVLRFSLAGRRGEIRQLAVERSFRGEGIGGELVDALIGKYPGAGLTVWTGRENAAALAVYEKRGFCRDGYTSQVLMKG